MSYSSPPNIISTPNLTIGSFTGTTSSTANTPTPLSSTSLLVRGFTMSESNTSSPMYITDSSGANIMAAIDNTDNYSDNGGVATMFFGSATIDLSTLYVMINIASVSYTVVYWQ